MDVVSLLNHCRRHGINLHVKNGELSYCAAKGAMTQEIMSAIRIRKNDILDHLMRLEESRFHITAASVNRAPLFNRFLWKDYSNRIMDVSSANATRIVTRNKGEILTDALLRSVNILLERHDILRSSIETAEGKLYLVCREKMSVAFQELTAAGEMSQQKEDDACRIADDLVWKEYDLDHGPLYRIFLVRFSATDYILGLALHHAIGDLLSIGILYKELLSVYSSIVCSTPLRLSPVRLRYIDYLASMETWSNSAACGEHIRYWKDRLKPTPVTGLLPDEKRSPDGAASEDTAEATLFLDVETSRELKKIAIQSKTTLFNVLLALYKIALRRMTGQDAPVVVALHAGRLDAGFQNAIGDFALEIAYKTDISGTPGFKEILARVVREVSEANSHQPVPLDWVRSALAKEGIAFSAPGINLMIGDTDQLQNPLRPRHLNFSYPGVRHGCHGFPVSCAVEFRDGAAGIEGSMVYRTDVYDKSTVETFLNGFIETAADVIKPSEMNLVLGITGEGG